MLIKEIRTMDEIDELIASSIKEKRTDVLSVLRLIKANAVVEEKKSGNKITEDGLQKVIVNAIKAHRDSIELYKKGKRDDLAEKEESELKIIMELTPGASFSNDDLINCVNEEIEKIKGSNGTVTMKDMGSIMGVVKSKFPLADGKLVSKIVAENIRK